MTTALWIVLVIFAWPIVIVLGIVIALVCANYADAHPNKGNKSAGRRKGKPTRNRFRSPIKLVKK